MLVLTFNLYRTTFRKQDGVLGALGGPVAWLGIQLFTLFLLALCRALTMCTSPEKLYKQRFQFFGGCIVHDDVDGKVLLYSVFGRSMW